MPRKKLKLKPCPFCGSEARVIERVPGRDYEVTCQDCWACLNCSFEKAIDATRAWNRRALLGEEG